MGKRRELACERVLDPLGLAVDALTRVPYLSGGDRHRELYVLDDVVLVCSKRDQKSSSLDAANRSRLS
jgi:hypothetical protein